MAGHRNRLATVLFGVVLLALGPTAHAQEIPDESRSVGPAWLSRVDAPIPGDLALRFANASVTVGLTAGQAARLLNDHRFVAAVGASDQGWGLLEAMVGRPETIADAWTLLRTNEDLTISGSKSFQYALMQQDPALRNPYLADLGHMVAARSDGIEVLVDIETGRQVTARGRLGLQVRAPGGGPLPSPSMSPEEVAAAMWEEAGIDPTEPEAEPVRAAGDLPEIGPGPGLNLEPAGSPERSLAPAVTLIGLTFLVTWGGYAAVMVARRLRSRSGTIGQAGVSSLKLHERVLDLDPREPAPSLQVFRQEPARSGPPRSNHDQ